MTGAASYTYDRKLAFRPIDLCRDGAELILFGRDLYVESLGDDSAFSREFGERGDRFLLWIATCGARDPAFAAMLTEDARPVGMVVLGFNRAAREIGHVHHFYVAPGRRGRGFGGLLDDYARDTLAASGFTSARLNVSKSNARAIRFYTAMGWTELPGTPARAKLLHFETPLGRTTTS